MEKTISLLGYGRFGKTFKELLARDFIVKVYDPALKLDANANIVDLATACKENIIFIAVPIHRFEKVVQQIAPLLQEQTTIIDLCSVKEYPVEIMQRYLPPEIGIVATHPMFGPDSVQSSTTLNMMMHATRDLWSTYSFWKNYWQTRAMNVIEMTPTEHDRKAAYSQAVTHLISRICEKIHLKNTCIDTPSFEKLQKVAEIICHDPYELSINLLRYNRYAKEMLKRFALAFEDIQEDVKRG